MPRVPCECGCGEKIPPINTNLKPARFKHGHNPAGTATRFKQGDSETASMGGKALWDKRGRGKPWRVNGGYYRVGIPLEAAAQYPTAIYHKGGRGASIARAHLVWNQAHPDDLVQKGEQVHHLNLIRDDDRLANLHKMKSADHLRLHAEMRKQAKDSVTGRFI